MLVLLIFSDSGPCWKFVLKRNWLQIIYFFSQRKCDFTLLGFSFQSEFPVGPFDSTGGYFKILKNQF